MKLHGDEQEGHLASHCAWLVTPSLSHVENPKAPALHRSHLRRRGGGGVGEPKKEQSIMLCSVKGEKTGGNRRTHGHTGLCLGLRLGLWLWLWLKSWLWLWLTWGC